MFTGKIRFKRDVTELQWKYYHLHKDLVYHVSHSDSKCYILQNEETNYFNTVHKNAMQKIHQKYGTDLEILTQE